MLAQHFAHAAPIEGTEKAVDYCIRAGRRAFADLAFEDAVEHFRRGLTLLDEHGPPDAGLRTELLVSLADTLMYTDQIAGQAAALDAVDAARRSGSPAEFARALLAYSRVSAPAALMTGHDPVLAVLLEEALPLLGDDEPTLRAQLLARRAFYSATFGLRMPDRLAVAEEALRLARTSDDPITLGDALFAVVACVAGTPDPADRIRMGEELVELGERNRAPRPWTFGLRVLARTHLELGDATAFDDAVTALADVGTDLRWVPAQAHAAQWRTAQAAAAGRFDDARVFSQELVRHGRVNRGFIAIYGSQLLHLLLEQGGIVDPADIEQRVSVQPENASLRATAAHLHLECGDAADARRHLAVLATDGFAAAAAEPSSPSTLARLAEVAVAVDATDSCAGLVGHLEPFRGTLVVAEHFGSLGAADRYLAMLAAALGHEADADAGFEQALAMEERAGAWALVPRTRYWQARALTGRDDVLARPARAARRRGGRRARDGAAPGAGRGLARPDLTQLPLRPARPAHLDLDDRRLAGPVHPLTEAAAVVGPDHEGALARAGRLGELRELPGTRRHEDEDGDLALTLVHVDLEHAAGAGHPQRLDGQRALPLHGELDGLAVAVAHDALDIEARGPPLLAEPVLPEVGDVVGREARRPALVPVGEQRGDPGEALATVDVRQRHLVAPEQGGPGPAEVLVESVDRETLEDGAVRDEHRALPRFQLHLRRRRCRHVRSCADLRAGWRRSQRAGAPKKPRWTTRASVSSSVVLVDHEPARRHARS